MEYADAVPVPAYGTAVQAGRAPLVAAAVDANDPSTWAATPRNAPSPCGSGKKHEHYRGRD